MRRWRRLRTEHPRDRGILDLLGEGVTDLEGANKAVEQYLEAAEATRTRAWTRRSRSNCPQLAQTVWTGMPWSNIGRILDRAALGGPGRDRHGGQQPGLRHPGALLEAAAQHPLVRAATGHASDTLDLEVGPRRRLWRIRGRTPSRSSWRSR